MTLQSCVRFCTDRINRVTICHTIIGAYYIIKQLASLSFKFVKPDCVRFILA